MTTLPASAALRQSSPAKAPVPSDHEFLTTYFHVPEETPRNPTKPNPWGPLFAESSGLTVMFFIYMRNTLGDHGSIDSATDV